MMMRTLPAPPSTSRGATPCPQLVCSARCNISAAASPREVAQTNEACMARRQVLSLPALLPLLAVASTSQPARAATDALPPSSVPGAVPLPDGEAILISEADTATLTPSEKQVYAQNRRIQAQNRTPDGFPGFVRKGFDVKVVGDFQSDESGLFYRDFAPGSGPLPVDGQEVVFHYTGYNESGTVIDSSYRQGRPAQTRLGVKGMIPGFELGIRGMRAGQLRRIIVPPALGPPVGPSTFFSAKQCEVFDVEMLAIRSCQRRQLAMFSDVVCS